jgi:glycosyltransferase involved in cell wall biosynthesis
VPPSEPDGLARAIEALLSDPPRALQIARNAEVRLQREFTLEAMIQRYEELYLSHLEAA